MLKSLLFFLLLGILEEMGTKLFFVIFFLALLFTVLFYLKSTISTPQDKLTTLPHKDAVLIHGYWFSQKGNGPITLSLRSELEVKAAALLYANNQADYFVITVGPIWGIGYPTLGEKMQQELETLGVPSEKIILSDSAIDTYDEVKTFLQLSKQYNFTDMEDLAFARHDLTIPLLYKAQHSQVTYLTVEQVIKTEGTDEDMKIINNFQESIYEFDFLLYESIIRTILFIDPQYKILGNYAQKNRVKKAPYGAVFFLPIDKYDL